MCRWIWIFAAVLCLTGCKSVEYVPVIEHQTDTLRQYLSVHDSIYLKDSTYIIEKGDTVRIEHWSTKFVKKEIHDTTYVATHDTIPKPYPVEKEVEKQLSSWQSFRMVLGTITLCILALYIIYKVIRRKIFPLAL